MLNYELRFEVAHYYHCQPDDCKTGTATDLHWDTQARRPVIELRYDNGAIDWVVASEFFDPVHFRLGREKDIRFEAAFDY